MLAPYDHSHGTFFQFQDLCLCDSTSLSSPCPHLYPGRGTVEEGNGQNAGRRKASKQARLISCLLTIGWGQDQRNETRNYTWGQEFSGISFSKHCGTQGQWLHSESERGCNKWTRMPEKKGMNWNITDTHSHPGVRLAWVWQEQRQGNWGPGGCDGGGTVEISRASLPHGFCFGTQ